MTSNNTNNSIAIELNRLACHNTAPNKETLLNYIEYLSSTSEELQIAAFELFSTHGANVEMELYEYTKDVDIILKKNCFLSLVYSCPDSPRINEITSAFLRADLQELRKVAVLAISRIHSASGLENIIKYNLNALGDEIIEYAEELLIARLEENHLIFQMLEYINTYYISLFNKYVNSYSDIFIHLLATPHKPIKQLSLNSEIKLRSMVFGDGKNRNLSAFIKLFWHVSDYPTVISICKYFELEEIDQLSGVHLAQSYYKVGEPAVAISLLKQLISRFPTNLELHDTFVSILSDEAGAAAVAAHYMSDANDVSHSIGTRYALALLDVRAGSLVDACLELQILSSEIEGKENQRKVRVALGRVFLELGSWPSARKIAEKILAEAFNSEEALMLRRDACLAYSQELLDQARSKPRLKEPAYEQMFDALRDSIYLSKLFPQVANEVAKRNGIAESILKYFPEIFGTPSLWTADGASIQDAANMYIDSTDNVSEKYKKKVEDIASSGPDHVIENMPISDLKNTTIIYQLLLYLNLLSSSIIVSLTGFGFWISLITMSIIMSISIYFTLEFIGRFPKIRSISNLSQNEDEKSRIGFYIVVSSLFISIVFLYINEFDVYFRIIYTVCAVIVLVLLWSLFALFAYRIFFAKLQSRSNAVGDWVHLCFSYGLTNSVEQWLTEVPERASFEFIRSILNIVRAELNQSGYRAATHAILSFLPNIVNQLPTEIQREASADLLETFEQAADLQEGTEFGLNQLHKRPPFSIGCVRFGQPLIRCSVKLGWLESSEHILNSILTVCHDRDLPHHRLSTLLNYSEIYLDRGDYRTAARNVPSLKTISEIDTVRESLKVKSYQESLAEHMVELTPGVKLGLNIREEKIQNMFNSLIMQARIGLQSGDVELVKRVYSSIKRKYFFNRINIPEYSLSLSAIKLKLNLKIDERIIAKRLARNLSLKWRFINKTWIKLTVIDSLLELNEYKQCEELINAERSNKKYLLDEEYTSELAVRQAEIAFKNRDFVAGRALARSAIAVFKTNRAKGGEARSIVILSKIEAKAGNTDRALELTSMAKELFTDLDDPEGLTRAAIADGIANLEKGRFTTNKKTAFLEAASKEFKTTEKHLEKCKLHGTTASELYDEWSETCFEIARTAPTREVEVDWVKEAFSHSVKAETGRAAYADEIDIRRMFTRLEKFLALRQSVEDWNVDRLMADIKRSRENGDTETTILLLWYVTQFWQTEVYKSESQESMIKCEEAWIELFAEVQKASENFIFEDERIANFNNLERFFDDAIKFATAFDRTNLLCFLLERSKSPILSEQLSLNVATDFRGASQEPLVQKEQALATQYRALLRKSISMQEDGHAEWERHIGRVKTELTALWAEMRSNTTNTKGSKLQRENSYEEIVKFIRNARS